MSAAELPAARLPRRPDADAAWRRLRRAACAPYRGGGRFARHFAQGKLALDPVFRALVERADLAGRPRIVDVGCGQGLLASLLQACNDAGADWPAGAPALPRTSAYTGIELMPRDVERAERALQAAPVVDDRLLSRRERSAGPFTSGLGPLGGTARSAKGAQ